MNASASLSSLPSLRSLRSLPRSRRRLNHEEREVSTCSTGRCPQLRRGRYQPGRRMRLHSDLGIITPRGRGSQEDHCRAGMERVLRLLNKPPGRSPALDSSGPPQDPKDSSNTRSPSPTGRRQPAGRHPTRSPANPRAPAFAQCAPDPPRAAARQAPSAPAPRQTRPGLDALSWCMKMFIQQAMDLRDESQRGEGGGGRLPRTLE